MTPNDLKTALSTLGWTRAELARRVHVHPNSVSQWVTGARSVPGPARAYLDLAVAVKALGV